jgi:MFS transporter, DHA1 family, inner membrane transport protein
MDPLSRPRFSASQIGVTLVIGSVALIMLGLQPVLLGELEAKHFITLEGVGIVAMGEILALGLGVALSNALLPISRHKLITMIAALGAAVGDIATLLATSDRGFEVLRAATGLAEGALLWSATSVIVRSASPERLTAIFMVVQTVVQAGVAALLAGVVVPRASWQGGFELLAALTALCAILATWLPSKLAPLQTHAAKKMRWTVARVLPLVIAFLQMAALGSLWAYLEPLGLAVGLDARAAQFMTSVVLVMQVAGGIAATGSIRRLAVVPTLGTGSAVLLAVAGGIHLLPAGAVSPFTLLCAVFGFTWLFLMPFQIGLAFRADSKGEVALLIPAAQLVGSAAGPLVASLTVSGDDVHTVPLVSLGFALGAAVLVTAARRLWVIADAPEVEVFPALERGDDPEPVSGLRGV